MEGLELHADRLATTDEKGHRVYLYPADVRGKFRKRRNWLQAVLILFFLALPWVEISGRQALLLDVSRRHFEVFGLSLRAHNAPLFFFVLAMAGFGLFFVTAIWGRVWCGWACPQTVFIDGVYRRIERWIEGSALERRRLDASPMGFEKIWKRTAKWIAYTAVSLFITHSFLAYFVGAKPLIGMIRSSPTENWASFLFILFSTGIILFDFAWFREQFCIIACPYGRFQSVLMDENSQVVAYDTARGEPRRSPQNKALAKNHGAALGDCVNCYRCVQVCPTGIDIRRGTQMECIACTACIDACDEVMTKVNKPTGLIRYDSINGLAKLPVKRLGVRAIAYLSVVIASLLALTYFLSNMKPVEIELLRAQEIPYTVSKLADGSEIVINHLKLELSNQTDDLHQIDVLLSQELLEKKVELVMPMRPYPIPSAHVQRADFFLKVPKSEFVNGLLKSTLTVIDRDSVTKEEKRYEKEVTIVGPF
jgi:cytochrome c oxidase accessory protein FixG